MINLLALKVHVHKSILKKFRNRQDSCNLVVFGFDWSLKIHYM